MGQIVSAGAKPKRCNKNQLSQLGVLAAGLHVLVSSDNSMNAAGQGNFDCYIVGDGTTAAAELPLESLAELEITQSKNAVSAKAVYYFLYGNDYLREITYNARQGTALNTTTQALAAEVDLPKGKECTFLLSGDTSILNGTMAVLLRNASYQGMSSIQLPIGTPVTFTPTYNVKLIGVYVSGTNVRANGTLSLKITYNGDDGGLVEEVQENTKNINGDIIDSVTYQTSPNNSINTTTQALAHSTNIASNTPFVLMLIDNDSVLLDSLAVLLYDENFTNIGSIIYIGSNTVSQELNLSTIVKYIGVYIPNADVGGSGISSIELRVLNAKDIGLIPKSMRLRDDVDSNTNVIYGNPLDFVTYPTSPNNPINTTTQVLAYATNIPANASFFLSLDDKDFVILGKLGVFLYDENYVKLGSTIYIGSNEASPDLSFTSAVRYISVYIAGSYVGGSAPTSVTLKVFDTKDAGLQASTRQAQSGVRDVQQNYRKSSDFRNKTCIYIGDSISTENGYKWKGMLEDYYAFKYVRGLTGSLFPANGGIPVIPPVTEPNSLDEKSIWYRCAEQRMSIYDFDTICLFGGTNDMNSQFYPNMELGTINDTPYVDTLDGFSSEIAATLTATRPEILTFAAAFMGCVEMLHRDYPTKTIIIPTVLPSRGYYGNTISDGMRLSERMAILQMQIANRYSMLGFNVYGKAYGCVGVPLYWSDRTYDNAINGAMSSDGVHPNLAQARSMANLFAENLFL